MLIQNTRIKKYVETITTLVGQNQQKALAGGVLLLTFIVSALYGRLIAEGVSFIFLLAVPIGVVALWMVFKIPEYAALCLLGFRWGFIFDSLDSSLRLQSPALPLALLLLVVFAVQHFGKRKRPAVSDPLFWVLLLYFGHVAFGVWYAAYPDLITARINDFSKDIVYTVVVAFFLTEALILERSMYLMVFIGAVLGSFTVYQEITQTYDNTYWNLAKVKIAFIIEGVEDRPRAAGPLQDPNFYGQQLLVLVPLALWWIFHARNIWMRLIAIYCMIAIMAGVGLSYSRGALLAVGVMFLLYTIRFRVQLKYLAYLLPLVVILFAIAPPELKARFSTLTQFFASEEEKEAQVLDSSFEGRSRYLVVGARMILDSPLIGLGADHFKAFFTQYVLEIGESPDREENRNAHNYYLEVTTEHGLIGISLVLTMMIMAVRRFQIARKNFLQVGDARMADLSGFLEIAFLGYMFSAFFLHGDFPRFLWLLLGVAIATKVASDNALKQYKPGIVQSSSAV
jgi:putative inorganic carbon (hco3(-)) transporter